MAVRKKIIDPVLSCRRLVPLCLNLVKNRIKKVRLLYRILESNVIPRSDKLVYLSNSDRMAKLSELAYRPLHYNTRKL